MFVEKFYQDWNELSFPEKEEFAKRLINIDKKKINVVFEDLKKYCPELVILMYYNDPSKEELCEELLKRNIKLLKDYELLSKIMYQTNWGGLIISRNAERIIELNEENIFYVIQYLISIKKYSVIKSLSLSPNLVTRGKVMIELLLEHERLFDSLYTKPITVYLKRKDVLMPERLASRLCYYISYMKPDKYRELRDFILDNYEKNDLAYYILNGDSHEIDDRTEEDKELQIELLKERINDIYRKSISGKLDIYLRFSELLDKDILLELKSKVLPFLRVCSEDMINILSSNLLNELIRMHDQYFENVTGADCISYEGYGATAQVFRVDDKVIKFCRAKFNKRKTQTITSYLIAPIIDSAYTYRNGTDIEYGIEIQEYYPIGLSTKEQKVFNAYERAFRESGLECEDLDYSKENMYQNLRYLNNYHDAVCDDPENLPEWFKQSPVVLIDSDLVKRKK